MQALPAEQVFPPCAIKLHEGSAPLATVSAMASISTVVEEVVCLNWALAAVSQKQCGATLGRSDYLLPTPPSAAVLT